MRIRITYILQIYAEVWNNLYFLFFFVRCGLDWVVRRALKTIENELYIV